MKWTQEKMNEIYLTIQKRAVTDEEYRKELLENPNAVIENVPIVPRNAKKTPFIPITSVNSI